MYGNYIGQKVGTNLLVTMDGLDAPIAVQRNKLKIVAKGAEEPRLSLRDMERMTRGETVRTNLVSLFVCWVLANRSFGALNVCVCVTYLCNTDSG
jgi:hypothetical protein